MFLVKLIFAFVLATILPDVVAEAMHHTILERTLKVATVSPFEASVTTHFILGPLTSVLTAVCPEINTFSFFDSISEIAVIVAAIAPYLDAFSILFVNSSGVGL